MSEAKVPPASAKPATPSAPVAVTPPPATSISALDLKNIQGDILSGLPKKTETFYLFEIADPKTFRQHLRQLIPLVTTVEQTLRDRDDIDRHKQQPGPKPPTIPLTGVNIAFSHFGFEKLKINDANLLDAGFLNGQLKDAQSLGDKGTVQAGGFVPAWDDAFKKQIDGVILVSGDTHSSSDKKIAEIEQVFKVGTPAASITEVANLRGDVRPGEQSGHEHFGYLDGISNPAVIGFDKNPAPGPAPVRPGVILLGEDGDDNKDKRDPWMVDGSFLVFRQLSQAVPEFDDFVTTNRIQLPGLNPKEGADLLGARLIGRWKSGAPIDLTPFFDDPVLANDPLRNNNFHFSAERDFQKLCPFAAHVRKTNPRADLEELGISIEHNRIVRRGIPFGPEVSRTERQQKRTQFGRGLLFVSYQSSTASGFAFLQKSWANNPKFPFGEQTPETPGLDPIIGQNGQDNRGLMSGVNPNTPSITASLSADWVIPRGGEYFFSPSIKALKETISTA